ncbi:MAG: hypothetical protein AAF089_13500 [Bacteroidota bacterium]
MPLASIRLVVHVAAAFFIVALAVRSPHARAQSIGGLSSAPLLPNRAPLALGTQTPSSFLPVLPDEEVQAFVNPARAAHLDGGLIYGTLRPPLLSQGIPVDLYTIPSPVIGGTGSQVTASVLTRGRGLRWLIVLDQRLVGDSNDTGIDETTTVTDNRVDQRVTSLDRTSLDAVTTARIAAIGRTRRGGWSVGLFGGARIAESTRLETTDISSMTIGFTSSTSSSEMLRDDASEGRAFAVGVELGRYEPGWEFYGSMGYQRAANEIGSRSTLFSTSRFEGSQEPPFVNVSENESLAESMLSDESNGVSIEAYAAAKLQAGHTLFTRYVGAYGQVDATSSSLLRTRRFQAEGFTEPFTVTEDETLELVGDLPDGDLDGGTTVVGVGYAYEATWRDAEAFAGVELFGYRIAEGQTSVFTAVSANENVQLSRAQQTSTGGGIRLPLYAAFPRRTPLRAFVGGVLDVTYVNRTSEETLTRTRLGEFQTERRRFDASSERYGTETAFVVGAQLRLKGGLRAQAAFNGNLATPGIWTVSMGYRF